MVGQDWLAVSGAYAYQSSIAGADPIGYQFTEQREAHVAGCDHSRQTLLARAFVVGKAWHPHPGRSCVGAYLVFSQEHLSRAECVADLDILITSLRLRHDNSGKLVSLTPPGTARQPPPKGGGKGWGVRGAGCEHCLNSLLRPVHKAMVNMGDDFIVLVLER
jgi:hypothetical protein